MWERIIRDAITLFVIVNPIGEGIPIFLAVTRNLPQSERRRVARRSVLFATGILLAFVVGGQILLQAMEIHLASFQIAGGIVLFLFGLKMIFATEQHHDTPGPGPKPDVAVFPLATPAIAGPGTMLAVVVLTDNDRFSIPEQMVTTLVLLGVLALTFTFLLLSHRIYRLIGDAGADIVSRVMGLILTALAVEDVIAGIKALEIGLK
jgi:multiple antibiotic resistance protein